MLIQRQRHRPGSDRRICWLCRAGNLQRLFRAGRHHNRHPQRQEHPQRRLCRLCGYGRQHQWLLRQEYHRQCSQRAADRRLHRPVGQSVHRQERRPDFCQPHAGLHRYRRRTQRRLRGRAIQRYRKVLCQRRHRHTRRHQRRRFLGFCPERQPHELLHHRCGECRGQLPHRRNDRHRLCSHCL